MRIQIPASIVWLTIGAMHCACAWAGSKYVAIPHVPSLSNIQRLKGANFCSITVGEFSASPKLSVKFDKEIPFRSSTLVTPTNNSFAEFLRGAIATELRMAGRLDTNSNIVITGQLTKNVANTTHMEIQDGEIAARFQFRRDGALVYDKEFSADAIWQVPIGLLQSQQEALTQYDNLYQSLIAKLIADLDSSGVCTEK